MKRLLATALLLLPACSAPEAPEAPEEHPCAPGFDRCALQGRWTPAERRADGSVLLVREPISPGDTTVQLVTFERTAGVRAGAAARERIELPGGSGRPAEALEIGRSRGGEHPPRFAMPGHEWWRRNGSLWIAAANALWEIPPEGGPRIRTADRTGDFRFDELAARQREGEVILYWVAAPVPAPNGLRVAYVTNREAVAAGGSGQSLWLLEEDRGSGAVVERPLLTAPGRWFRAEGWYGGRVVFIADTPGVFTVDPDDGRVERIGTGTLLAVARDGSGVALEEAGVLRILQGPAGSELDPPTGGRIRLAQASFSPRGEALLFATSERDGGDRRFEVVQVTSGARRQVPGPGGDVEGWPEWLDEETLLFGLGTGSPPGPTTLLVRVGR